MLHLACLCSLICLTLAERPSPIDTPVGVLGRMRNKPTAPGHHHHRHYPAAMHVSKELRGCAS
eukprot:15124932-Alexandrium_andersonii.AAC.1